MEAAIRAKIRERVTARLASAGVATHKDVDRTLVHVLDCAAENPFNHRVVIEPRDRAKDFVFGHEATYSPGHEVDQISSEPQRAV
jgi:hypothetical protein